MVLHNSPDVLIVTASAAATSPLDDLVADCGWPLVLKANPRRLATELSLHDPECLLFWLEDDERIAETARLVSWMRERGQRPYRLAAAYRTVADVESLFRAAGAHAFLHVADQPVGRVTNIVRSLLGDARVVANSAAGSETTVAANVPAARTVESLVHLVQPP